MNSGHRVKWLVLAAALLLSAIDVAAQVKPGSLPERGDAVGRRMMRDAQPTQFVLEDDPARRRAMTPEERRQLRRDVHEAGRDLYPERMRERRREMRRGE